MFGQAEPNLRAARIGLNHMFNVIPIYNIQQSEFVDGGTETVFVNKNYELVLLTRTSVNKRTRLLHRLRVNETEISEFDIFNLRHGYELGLECKEI